MGRPLLASKYFGPEDGKIKIRFHNGNAVVNGYVVSQTGSTRYTVSLDGTQTFPVELVQSTAEATALTAGKATITATDKNGNAVFIRALMNFSAVTTAGDNVVWGNPSDTNAVTVAVKQPLLGLNIPDNAVAIHRNGGPLRFFAYVNLTSPDYVYQLAPGEQNIVSGGTVDWGDGTGVIEVSSQDDLFHVYDLPGIYNVFIHFPVADENSPTVLLSFKERLISLNTDDSSLFDITTGV